MTTTLSTAAPAAPSSPAVASPVFAPLPGAPAQCDSARLAVTLQQHRHELARLFMQSVAGWEKYRPDIEAAGQQLDAYLRHEFYVFVDYLALLYQTGDSTYRHLFLGEKVKQAYWEPQSSAAEQIVRRGLILDHDRESILPFLADKLGSAELATLTGELNAVAATLTAKAGYSSEVLLVGDCLFLDVMAFLVGPALEDGIAVNPTFLTSKNPPELRNSLRKLADRKFDLVFYSPFTYEFAPEYARLMEWRQGTTASSSAARRHALAALDNALPTIDLLTDLFECNIFVHNSANIRRHDSKLGELAKNLLTRRARAAARRCLNARLAEHVTQRNAATYDHLFLIDEMALLQQHGERELGRVFYDSDLQHPAAMGKWLAEQYRDILAVHAQLLKKKLVICDLDNTLWKGVIGEGAVEHYADKQRILKRLQAKGVVLAINSKNDPKNVKWDGGVLCADDFVCAQINWESKVGNIKRIGQILNLKTKDFVFIDDRADEREMVNMSIPEVLTLDATSDRAWRLLDLWSRVLSSQGETDRTQFYKQKEQRDSFLQSQTSVVEDQGALFSQLGLKVTVRDAKNGDLKRVAELINRTNQFNTCGSRTSVREITDWLAAGDRRILVVDCGDKFGSMGTICIAVLHDKPASLEIPIFVLSCRVFGYGIENVVVNAVKRLARRRGVKVVGPFKETPHNEPCRKVYPENGFTWDGSAWIYDGSSPTSDPTWLTIDFEDPSLKP